MRILMLSHFFPPLNKVGAIRAGFFAEFLAGQGLDVHVLRGSDRAYGTDVFPDHVPNPAYTVSKVDFMPTTPELAASLPGYLAYKRAASDLLTEEQFDVVFMTGDPFFYFPLAKHIRQRRNAPCILDMRDPCYIPPGYFNNRPFGPLDRFNFGLVNLLHRLIENRSLPCADRIINVNETLTADYRQRFPAIREKFITIMNGYDERNAPAPGQLRPAPAQGLVAGIFGKFSFYNPGHADSLARTVRLLLDRGIDTRIVVVGQRDTILDGAARRHAITDAVRQKGPLEYRRGMTELSNSNVLLLNNFSSRAFGTKIFDYVYLNRPIVALARKDSAIARFLEPFRNAFVAEDRAELERCLTGVAENGLTTLDPDVDITRYSRRAGAEQLLQTIRSLKKETGDTETVP